MDVVRDLLDKLVLDRNRREIGRVDGLTIDLSEDGPPRLTAVLVGPRVLGERLHPAIGRLVTALGMALGIDEGKPVRINMKDVEEIRLDVRISPTISEIGADTVERQLRRWLSRIPEAE
jgi:hypothetical protein